MFELCEAKDILELAAFFERVKKEMFSAGIFQWTQAYPREAIILEDIKAKQLYKIVEASTIVAVATLQITQHSEAWLRRMATHPSYEQRGFAGQLLAELYQVAQQENCQTIWTATNHTNKKMQRFLENHGFHCVDSYLAEDRQAYGKFLVYNKQMDVKKNDKGFGIRQLEYGHGHDH